ncbi:U3 small nucleolar RNA-associated protein 6-domain-containing protein [Ganoderma leucocontextum]|nr:U3 small nucleolar RNA-associated protein 6-domain-containing protein [Ganoderma leucocontextum]
MERVQFQQEQMLNELKDLIQKGLFSQKEAKQIMQKRTAFETALIRRVPKKCDFLRYATYEMSLEALRRKRAERLKIAKGSPSVSDYALVRRQFQIFERALKKFKGDVGLWIQYIQVAKKEGARALVGRITARAVQLHPNVPALYVLAASHELEHLSPTAARALLQRGLRMNSDSVEMWREYVRMELGFVEGLRRRWSVLGIDVKGKGKDTGAGKGEKKDKGKVAVDLWSGIGGEDEGEADGMDVDAEEDLMEDEVARRQIMEGAIVKSVISSAVKAIPRIELFTSLHGLISAYPSPPALRESLLDYLHIHLHETLPSLPAAIKLSAMRHLMPDLTGETLVDALKRANEQLLDAVRHRASPSDTSMAKVYAEFVQEWCEKDVDDSLKAYLITSIHLLIQQLSMPIPPDLLAAHIRLLVSHHGGLGFSLLPPKANTPEKILRVARKHSVKAPACTIVWLARLAAETQFAEQEDVDRTWNEARKHVEGDGIQEVWLWGLEPQNRQRSSADSDGEADVNAEVGLVEHLLHESQLIRHPAAATALREALLIRYAAATHHALTLLYRPPSSHHGSTSSSLSDARSVAAGTTTTSSLGVATGVREIAQAQRKWHRQDSNVRSAKTGHHSHGDEPDSGPPSTRPSFLEARLARVRRIGTAYVPSARVWTEVFEQESSAGSSQAAASGAVPGLYSGDVDGDARVLGSIYEFWRQQDGVGATIAWATWLLRNGKGKDAAGVIARVRSVLGQADGEAVESKWKTILDGDARGEDGEVGGMEEAGPTLDSLPDTA